MAALACAICSCSAKPLRTMLHPAAAKRSADASPSPPTDPVISTHLPFNRDYRPIVGAGTHLALLEDPVLRDPSEGFFIHFLRIRLEDDPFAGPPSSRVHLFRKARRELFFVVVRVALWVQIDIPLRAPQPA